MNNNWNISTIARIITEDPNININPTHITRQYADRALSINLFNTPTLLEDQPPSEYDTIGNLEHDYPIFMESLKSNKDNIGALTIYGINDYADKNAKLYKLKGIKAGFAVAGDGDIISVHNSESKGSPYRGIGRHLVKLAKEQGGTKLDHFDFPKLNEIYSAEGFKEYERFPWNDEYAPPGWDYEKFGKPDLVFRKL